MEDESLLKVVNKAQQKEGRFKTLCTQHKSPLANAGRERPPMLKVRNNRHVNSQG